MEVLPIDLESIIAIVMGISIVLIPVAGITARFALKPTVEALARLFEHRGLHETVGVLERRMSLLEAQMESLDGSLTRIADAVEFDRELHVSTGGDRRRLAGDHVPGGQPADARPASARPASGQPASGQPIGDQPIGDAAGPDRGGTG